MKVRVNSYVCGAKIEAQTQKYINGATDERGRRLLK
jgi:hypothetical protein